MTEYGPYGLIKDHFDRALTEAWLEEDRQAAADQAAEDERFAALSEAEQLAELAEADWGL
jgi:membrane protein required for beta-lactamase induction